MTEKKVFTYISPKTNQEIAESLCNDLPIILKPVQKLEELFSLLSNPDFCTDFVCISIELFDQRVDNLDMFDIVHTLSTLIKSTQCRSECCGALEGRNCKILVIVDETTEVNLIKDAMSYPDIACVGWLLKGPEDVQESIAFVENLNAGVYQHHPKVLERVSAGKKKISNKPALTDRQAQVLNLVQCRGATNKTIAKMLGLSESTVKLHIGAVLKKYGVKNRTQLAVFSKEKNI
jgi:DNA-binding CsgD family transcriptional regulator